MLQLVPQLLLAGRAYDLAAGSPTSTTLPLSFLNVPGARSYEYAISSTSAVAGFGAWTALASDKIITGLASSTQYWAKVRIVNGVARGHASPVVTGTTSGASTTTLNPSDKAAVITLSGGNLVMTAGATDGSARSIANHTTGKYYCEAVPTVGSTAYREAIGIANATASLTAGPGSPDANSASLYVGDAAIYVAGGASGVSDGTVAVTNTVSMAVDLDNKRLWFRVNGGNWNNNGANDPATNTGGADISALTGAIYALGYAYGGDSGVVTFNFGATAYAYTPPSGFGNW